MTGTRPATSQTPINVAIIGAGPYGLSIAAHLAARRVPFRIFGTPMGAWRHHMPQGMCLKSDGFASDLYDPGSTLTLKRYCRDHGLEYADLGYPIPIKTFIEYGLEFQRRFAPHLEDVGITHLTQTADGFVLQTGNGESLRARKVVVATGISNFNHIPPVLSGLPEELLTHSSDHGDMTRLRGRRVAVIGAGASAVDLAALLHEAGVDAQLVARRHVIAFHTKTEEPRPLLTRIRKPRSGLGLGWKSKLCTDLPQVFHLMPQDFRLRVVRNHLGPAPGYFVRDMVVGRVPMHLGTTLRQPVVHDGRIILSFDRADGANASVEVDHVVAATGYRVALSRLGFIDAALRNRIHSVEDTPVLRGNFETSVRNLFMVGLASANSFGPLARFAYGARFTARRVAPALAG